MEPLRELLDKIYELEGLVTLAIKREEGQNDLLRLIKRKGKEIGNMTSSLSQNDYLLDSDSDNGNMREPEEYNMENENDVNENFPLSDILSHDDNKSEIISSDNYILGEYNLDEKNRETGQEDSSENTRGKLVFSINERYRFKKDLFDNSDIAFNNSLALVASMENYEEAEDYFLNEIGMNNTDKSVNEFLDIIRKYFR